MPWGRERLAEGAYEIALKELAKENPDHRKALWHLNAATNLNPKFIEAIKLKQTLTGREITSTDNSTIRTFVTRQILAERANPTPPPAPEATPVDPAVLPEPEADPAPQAVTEVPTLQPVAEAPTTQPVTEAVTEESVAQTPTTQPAEAVSGMPMLQSMWPTFDGKIEPVLPATESTDGRSTVTVVELIPPEEDVEVVESPVDLPFTITELPIDEIGVGGDNK